MPVGALEASHRAASNGARLQQRGVNGVKYVVSDDHDGLKAALNALMPGILWQRCQCHLQCNAAGYVPKTRMRKQVHNDIRNIFNAPRPPTGRAAIEVLCG